MLDLKIYYQCEPGEGAGSPFEEELSELVEKFGLEFKKDHFDRVNLIRMVYFRKCDCRNFPG